MKARFFWISLVVIGISWAANTIFAYSKQLAAPIFLEHYIETVIDEDSQFTLYYLTNKYDPSSVSHVNLGGITGYITNDFFPEFYDDPNLQTFNRYGLRSVQIKLDDYDLETIKSNEPITINEIDVFFSDGRSVTTSIGEITILQSRLENKVLYPVAYTGINTGLSVEYYEPEESLTIESFSNPFSKTLGDQVIMTIESTSKTLSDEDFQVEKVSGTDIRDIEFPYEINKDENFNIYTQIPPDFVGYLNASVIFSGTTASGKPFKTYHPFYSQQPYLTQKDVNRLIKERGRFQ